MLLDDGKINESPESCVVIIISISKTKIKN